VATLIFDASVIVKLFVDEVGSAEARVLAASVPERLIPAHALAEVGDVLARKVRDGTVTVDQLDGIARTLAQGYASVPVENLLDRAISISLETGASVYDCLYVALAAAENCPLVTADRRLVEKLSNTPYAGLLSLLDSSIGSR
jgi:predicted nucleic acid-binding protein